MNILFRADSSSKIGLGHIMRDLVFASRFKDDNITFATKDLRGNINHKILKEGYRVVDLKSNNKKDMLQLIKLYKIDMLVIDNYEIDYKYEKYIKDNSNVKIISFDDTYEKHYCDVLINHNLGADKKRYKSLVPSWCEIRCGSEYTLLREEFYKAKKKKKKQNKKYKSVFLAMGGSDYDNVSLKVVKTLQDTKNLQINVISSSSNKNINKLKNHIKNKDNIELHIDSKKIAKIMAQSDFAIISPSVILNEVYFMQIPFIAIKTADNQKYIYDYIKEQNFLTLKKFKKQKLKEKVKKILKGLQ